MPQRAHDEPVYDVTFLTARARRVLVALATGAALVLGMLAAAPLATAAAATGTVVVTVRDQAEAAVPGIKVTVQRDDDSRVVASGTTGSTGTTTVVVAANTYYRVCAPPSLDYSSYCTYGYVSSGQSTSLLLYLYRDPDTGRGTVLGTVTDQVGQPVVGADLEVYTTNPYRSVRVRTNSLGRWSLSAPAQRSYAVCVDESGTHDSSCNGTGDLLVPGGRQRVDVQVERYARVVGRVTGPTGQAAPGITVSARRRDSRGEIQTVRSVTTGSDGRYDLGVEADSGARVYFSDPTGVLRPEYFSDAIYYRGAAVLSPSLDRPRTADAQLSRAASITGTVVAQGYRPVVRALRADGTVAGRARTKVDGTYVVNGLAAGSYTVDFARISAYSRLAPQIYRNQPESAGSAGGTTVTVGDGRVVSRINATLPLGGRLTGRLVDGTGAPLRCVVQAYTTDGALATRSAYSGRDGSFSIAGLSTGTYKIRAAKGRSRRGESCNLGAQVYTGPGRPLSRNVADAVPVSVVRGADRALSRSLVYTRGSTLSGTISAPSGASSGRVTVIARDAQGRVAGKTRARVRPGGTGAYSLTGLAAGTYTVAFNRISGFSAEAAQFFSRVPEGTGRRAATKLTLGAATSRSGVNATLQTGGVLTGVLRSHLAASPDPDAPTPPLTSVRGCTVQAYRADRRMVTRTGLVLADGRFTIRGLSTGSYKLRVLGGGRCRAGTQYFVGGATLGARTSSRLLRVQLGRTRDLGTLEYTPGATLAGTVTGPNAYGSLVVVRNSAGKVAGVTRAYGGPGGPGSYAVPGLPAGQYTVTFNRLSGYSTSAPQRFSRKAESASGTVVTLAGNRLRTGVDAQLAYGGHVTGRLVDPAGRGLDCSVQAFTADGKLVTRSARTASDGSFDIPGLSTGSYLVRVVPSGDCVRTRYVVRGSSTLAGEQTAATPVAVRLGLTTRLSPTLVYEGATGSGSVTPASTPSSPATTSEKKEALTDPTTSSSTTSTAAPTPSDTPTPGATATAEPSGLAAPTASSTPCPTTSPGRGSGSPSAPTAIPSGDPGPPTGDGSASPGGGPPEGAPPGC